MVHSGCALIQYCAVDWLRLEARFKEVDKETVNKLHVLLRFFFIMNYQRNGVRVHVCVYVLQATPFSAQ